MNTKKRASQQEQSAKAANLDACYGEIGIQAVAAALPYGGQAKNPAYAPCAVEPRYESEEAA